MLTRSLASTLHQTILLLAMRIHHSTSMAVFAQTRLPFRDMTNQLTIKYLSACAFSMERKFQSFHQQPFGHSLSRSTYQTTIGYPLCCVLESDVLTLEAKVGFEPTWAEPTAYKTVPIDLYGTWPY